MSDNILHRRIVRELVTRGGILDVPFNDFRFYLRRAVSDSYKGRWCDSWRDAYQPVTALKYLLDKGVPIWFIRRHIKFIAHECVWFRGNTRCNITKILERGGFVDEVGKLKKVLINEWNNDMDDIKYSSPLLFESDYYKYSEAKISDSFGVYWYRIYLLWSKVSDRYLAIHGLDCKMCGNHKKQSTIICEDLSKYKTDICADCLKGFCKLTTEMKTQTIKQFGI